MDIALVTGADAGPGLAIARRLIGMGCRVYALATLFPRNPFPHDDFIPLACDLADPAALTKVAEDIVAREGHISFVVHAARRAPASLFDSPIAELVQRVNVGLLAPLALARVTLPWLRKEQGHFLVLCWNGDGPAPGGPVTAAIEGGLHHFTDALFDELRSDGIRATTVYARANAETSPEAAFALDPQSAINPELLAETVEHLFRSRPSNVVSALVICPAATSETPRLLRSAELAGITTRDVQLPSREHFPREPEPIPTPKRARPADAPLHSAEDMDDEDEEEDWDPDEEPLPWAPNREDEFQGAPEEAPRRQGEPPQQGPRGYDQGQGGGNRSGNRGGGGRGQRGGRGGRGRGRGGRGQPNDNYGNRPPGGGQPRPPGPSRSGPSQPAPTREPEYPHREPEYPNREPQYPDREDSPEDRSFSRDDSFRTPHSESDEDNGHESAPRDGQDEGREDARPRDDHDRREESFSDDRAAPVSAETRRDDEAPYPARDDRDPRHEPAQSREPSRSAQRHPQEGRQRHSDGYRGDPPDNRGGGQDNRGGGPRRHRGYGRQPPPGGARGPGRE
jgi:NAD(P)-dependent dehydrogenase (short-subunit alcohol dehydrogenase family)